MRRHRHGWPSEVVEGYGPQHVSSHCPSLDAGGYFLRLDPANREADLATLGRFRELVAAYEFNTVLRRVAGRSAQLRIFNREPTL